MLQILVVGGDYTHHALVVQLLENGLCYGSANLRLGAAAKLINQHKCAVVAAAEKRLHVLQMRTVGAQVVFYRLLVANVDEYVAEYAHVRVAVKRRQNAALHHVLHHAHRFQAHALATGVGARYYENAVAAVKLDVERHHLLALLL